MGRPVRDITNQRFSRLVVLGKDGHKGKNIMWKCQCDCGKVTRSNGSNLTSGKIKSCGCLASELISVRNKENPRTPPDSTTHGMSHTSEYNIWLGIKKRCKDVDNIYYGGRGITICEEWEKDFMSFYNHIGERPSLKHSIDRIDYNGNYEPGNVRWATPKEQAQNRRKPVLFSPQFVNSLILHSFILSEVH